MISPKLLASCPLCGEWVDRLVKHHVSYRPPVIVYVCRSCHAKLHFQKKAALNLSIPKIVRLAGEHPLKPKAYAEVKSPKELHLERLRRLDRRRGSLVHNPWDR